MVQGFGQGMGLGQVHRQIGDRLREQPLDGAGDARELGIALCEVVFAVQLVQEESRGRRIA